MEGGFWRSRAFRYSVITPSPRDSYYIVAQRSAIPDRSGDVDEPAGMLASCSEGPIWSKCTWRPEAHRAVSLAPIAEHRTPRRPKEKAGSYRPEDGKVACRTTFWHVPRHLTLLPPRREWRGQAFLFLGTLG